MQWLYTSVANVCPECFICFFRRMLQVFIESCICFTHMLQMICLDVVYLLQRFSSVHVFFASVSDACFKCFICLQTYVANVHLDVSKVNRVLHMLQWHRWLANNGLPLDFGSYLAPSSRSTLQPVLFPPIPFLSSISLW
jgi:hypothetical protein